MKTMGWILIILPYLGLYVLGWFLFKNGMMYAGLFIPLGAGIELAMFAKGISILEENHEQKPGSIL